ncbi:imidazole glycerol phosphate synthase subunit HisH [Sutterella sp.]|uniref:imidazole glycerol phosphate synthase subunit HisH n=1 Tax=Sutterella sp. TaxID=1981025 RepID=UPI0026DF0163|nr:imidazole glycerol phosphate synthase subunit HisH [Sutterella sp.]MDO5531217.1 imidazole glycerol phosphate synthase subunit HisH [Sutterella sp.]
MRVVILDTGTANLTSLANAVKRLGFEPNITRDPEAIRAADRIFLPGVGTARAAMDELNARGLPELIRAATQPVLGICLGEQLLGRQSEETGGVDLLNLIPADVRELKVGDLPLPHMGWNRVYPTDAPQAKLLFKGIPAGDWFYFVHSYAMPVNPCTIASAEYGEPFTAAAARDNFMGVQFHPERSGKTGAKLLANFLGVD